MWNKGEVCPTVLLSLIARSTNVAQNRKAVLLLPMVAPHARKLALGWPN